MLERGEAIGLLVILAIMLVATLYVAVRRTPSFGVVFAPVELALAGGATAMTEHRVRCRGRQCTLRLAVSSE